MYYCSCCLIVRNDHQYIREWLTYYLLIGVDHFYVTDNRSEPPLNETVQDFIDAGLLTYRYDRRIHPQVDVYNESLNRHRKETKWMIFFDSDEFLLLKKDNNILEFLF